MPFVQRVVVPKHLSKISLHDTDGRPKVKDDELEAVTNFTFCNVLRQLASVMKIANEIFLELNKELENVTERSKSLRNRIDSVELKVNDVDPKSVTVPESDLTEFWSIKSHYETKINQETCLFTENTRPVSVKNLYEAAASPPKVPTLRRQGSVFNVTPIIGHKKRALCSEIETRKPAVLNCLRRWTSSEALGSITVDPDCTVKVVPTDFDLADHTLPSPEEQLQAVALKFPPEVIAVDVSGKSFERMCSQRRSLITGETTDGFKRKTKTKRSRSKRRNTIAGTDAKEIAAIVSGSGPIESPELGKITPEGITSPSEKKSHLENLKEWGRSRLRQIKNIEPSVRLRSVSSSRRKWDKEEPNPHSSSGNWSASSESGHSTATSHLPRSSISSGSVCPKHKKPVVVSTSSSVTSESTTLTPDDGETCSMYSCDTEGYYTSFHLDSGLKTLREEEPCTPIHCTSALSVNSQINQSAAESEYELFGKGSTSTTASSAGTVCTTLLVPPIAPTVPERVGSQLSGNKTLPERTARSHETVSSRETQSLKLCKKSDIKMLTFDEVKQINENSKTKFDESDRNCVITVDVHHEHRNTSPEKCGDSPDSGHNTCSSPVDSIASPSLDLEMSECSDLEGVDRMERIRVKTTINSSRIPSMCVITPPQSDDEMSLNQYNRNVDSGEYVTIADVRPNNTITTSTPPKYNTISPIIIRESEYVSLNDLPAAEGLVEPKRQGARVTLNAEGKVVYTSDSLRRRKAVHTTGTFEPGPCVSRSDNSPVPQRQANVRPVTTQSPLFANRKTITPSPVQNTTPKSPQPERKELQRPPLTTVSINRTLSPPSQKRLITSNQKQYFSQSSLEKSSNICSRPLSPLVSPTLCNNNKIITTAAIKSPTRSASPRMIVKATTSNRALSPVAARGAYVNMNQMSEDSKQAIKRSDSYRLANEETKVFNPNVLGRKQYGPGVIAGPSLLSAIQAARTNKAAQRSVESEKKNQLDASMGSNGDGQSTWPRSTSTPTKSNISSSSLDFSTVPSPIQKSISPPKNSRSAMDLYAVIHESKKRIQNLQTPIWPKTISAKSVSPLPPEASAALPKPMAPLNDINQLKYTKQSNVSVYGTLPRLQVQKLEQSPRNLARKAYGNRRIPPVIGQSNQSLASDRHGPSQPTSRTDFKKLLLQTGWNTPPSIGKESAVERLKNRTPKTKPLKYDVLSSTIPEDCDDEEEQTPINTLRTTINDNYYKQTKTNPALETAL